MLFKQQKLLFKQHNQTDPKNSQYHAKWHHHVIERLALVPTDLQHQIKVKEFKELTFWTDNRL